MPQIVLDPRTATSVGSSWKPSEPLAIEIRRFGFYPNCGDWLPGDLLLVSEVIPDWIHRQITDAQVRAGYHADDARWQHAAIYMGDGRICEAGTHGVQYASIAKYVGKHQLRVRRDSFLTSDERWKLAIRAVVRLGERYNFAAILSVYRHSYALPWKSALRA